MNLFFFFNFIATYDSNWGSTTGCLFLASSWGSRGEFCRTIRLCEYKVWGEYKISVLVKIIPWHLKHGYFASLLEHEGARGWTSRRDERDWLETVEQTLCWLGVTFLSTLRIRTCPGKLNFVTALTILRMRSRLYS